MIDFSSLVKTFVLLIAIFALVGAFNAAKEVYFALYTRKNPTTEQRITASVVSISKTNFDPAYSTRIYIHGMITDHTAPLPTALTAAYLKKGNFNVILVDWKTGAEFSFFEGIKKDKAFLVAEQVADLVQFLVASNYTNLETLIVSGHSMGAQVAGFIGKKVPGIGAIVAMDTPFYDETKPAERLASTDAKIVQIINTANQITNGYAMGTANFFMNGGPLQPGCDFLDLQCAHMRAGFYYVESINSKKFTVDGIYMGGEPLSVNARGKYELRTNANSPYARG